MTRTNKRIKQGNTRKIKNNNNTTVVPEGVIPCVGPGYYENAHTTLLLVEVRLNEATRLPCVATRNGGGRDPGG